MPVEALERAGVAARVAPVTKLRVEVVQIHKNEASLEVLQNLERSQHRLFVVRDANARSDPTTVEDIADLPDCIYPNADGGQPVQEVGRRVERIIAPIWRSHERAGTAGERAGDHTIDLMWWDEHRSRALAPVVERFKRDDLFVRRDLEDD